MTRWQHFRSAFRLPSSALEVTIHRPERLADKKITEILQAAPDAHLLYRAIMQLLEEAEREAVSDVAAGCWNKLTMAMHAGGAKYLRAVMDDILRRRTVKRKTPNA